MSIHFHYSSSCLRVKSHVFDFGSKEMNSNTTCSSYLANSKSEGQSRISQTRIHKLSPSAVLFEEVPWAGVTWSRTKCAKLAHMYKQKIHFCLSLKWFRSANYVFEATKTPLIYEDSHTPSDRFAYSSKTVLPCAENRRSDVIFLNLDEAEQLAYSLTETHTHKHSKYAHTLTI